MQLSGLHLLLTYQCTSECEHCFVWGSPRQSGCMSLGAIQDILEQAGQVKTIRSIYFEGGEPFLYYATLRKGVEEAARKGFQTGIVTNAYWAIGEQDAFEALQPFAGLVHDLSVSSDLFHHDERLSRQARDACAAADKLGIPVGLICIADPERDQAGTAVGLIPPGESRVMFRGRAAVNLLEGVAFYPWEQFDECPHEDLRRPGRVHVDPFGNLHLCQGISAGNLFQTPLAEICAHYQPDAHPICGPLLAGGPAQLASYYGVPVKERYADACHLCYETRQALRGLYPQFLTPDAMYGVF